MGKRIFFVGVIIAGVVVLLNLTYKRNTPTNSVFNLPPQPNPLSIEAMKKRDYPGSEIVIEETLEPVVNYRRYIASYKSDGLKIYGLLTVPTIAKPDKGYPAIVFNHGYIPPSQYKTTERYLAYVDGFARNGYVVFKIDYRGHGNSEGRPEGAYYSPAYTVDVLNAVASIKRFTDVDPGRIGMWGHSMGGNLTLRSMVVSTDIKAGVIWGGVVGSYDEILHKWRGDPVWRRRVNQESTRSASIRSLIDKMSSESARLLLESIDPSNYLNAVSGPVQLHQGLADETVPHEFSESLKVRLEQAGKTVELFEYEGADHNLSGAAFGLAMQRSVEFFDKYLKQ